MGINLGAFIAPLVCGYLGQRVNWHLGFGAAGVGMVLGLVQYVLGAQVPRRRRPPAGAGASPDAAAAEARGARLGRRRAGRRRCSFGVGIVRRRDRRSPPADRRRRRLPAARHRRSRSSAWLFFAGDWTPAERKRLYAIGVLFLAAALFWSRVRAGRLDAEPVRRSRARATSIFGWTFPSSWFQSLQPLFIITFAPVFAWLWLRLGRQRAVEPGQVRARPAAASAPASRCSSSPRTARRTASQVSPMWLVVDLPAPHLRRAVPQPGRPERDDASSRRRASAA